jgi:hypothetical protein
MLVFALDRTLSERLLDGGLSGSIGSGRLLDGGLSGSIGSGRLHESRSDIATFLLMLIFVLVLALHK